MLCSTQQNLIFQHYYQSYRNYLLSLGRMDGEQAVLLTVNFKRLQEVEFHSIKDLE